MAAAAVTHGSRTSRLFAVTAAAAAMVTLTYTASLFAPSYLTASIASSMYFVGVDIMLMGLLGFTARFTKLNVTRAQSLVFAACNVWMLFEMIIFAINPVTDIAISYHMEMYAIPIYEYEPKLLFNLHLCFTYSLVAAVVFLLVRKCVTVPKEYRITFVSVLLSLLVVVAVNAVFLFLPNLGIVTAIDWSTWGYAVGIGAMYWSKFIYRKRGLLNRLKYELFEKVDQGIVLFDYTDHLILHNAQARDMLRNVRMNDDLRFHVFLEKCSIDEKTLSMGGLVSVQCYGTPTGISTGANAASNAASSSTNVASDASGSAASNATSAASGSAASSSANAASDAASDSNAPGSPATPIVRPLRCDFRTLTNKQGMMVGKLFVFSDMSHSTDLLTGFQSFDSFSSMAESRGIDHPKDMTAVVCDPNGLAAINQLYGRSRGDQAIRDLAYLMQKHMPTGTYFVRGRDAKLIAFCYKQSSRMIEETMERIRTEYPGSFQFAFADLRKYDEDPARAIVDAEKSLRTKKLLDKGSARSSMLTSLIQALQESDGDTEAHVKRTQILGARLGDRIGLSDIDRGNLALLCLLHDIGKIGIPLEILNKPGKLTEEEWTVLRSHTEKGYQIAMSSSELRGIADMIKYHHEQWDGKGYPEGLSRESIPLLSRIIAVVDAYDAMISTRAYRKGMSKEMAIEELRAHAGTQFDPFIVSEFIQMMAENEAELNELLSSGASASQLPSASASAEPLRMQGGDYLEPDPTSEDLPTNRVHNMSYTRYILNADDFIISTDANFERITGYSEQDVKDLQLQQFSLIPEDDRTEYLICVQEQMANNDLAYFEHRLLRKDGSIGYVFCMGRRYFDSAALEERSEVVVTNLADTFSMKELTSRQEAKAQARLAQWENTYRRDSLTGLLTHSAFRSDVESILLKDKSKVLYLMMDLDNFKVYNDTHGHQQGDEFLIFVAQSITGALRTTDLASRVGGDEFAAVMVFSEDTSDDAIKERARQFFDAISVSIRSSIKGSSVSMGGAIGRGSEDSFNALYARADQALYQSKNNGRDKLTM